MSSPAQFNESTIPYPPRFWWLKRIGIASIASIALLAVLWILWNYDANRRLNAAVATVRAHGDPILLSDFAPSPVPDSENYVYYLRQAIAAFNRNAESPTMSNMSFQNRLPLPKEWYTMAASAIAGNQATLGLLRTARQHPKVDWAMQQARRPLISGLFQGATSLNAQRELATLLGDAAEYQHLQGDDSQAVEILRDLFALSNATGKFPTLINFLTAEAMDVFAVSRIDFIAPNLRVSDKQSASTTNPSEKPASRTQIVALIQALLQIDPPPRYLRALEFERMLNFDLGQWRAENSWLLAPMYRLDNARGVTAWQSILAALPQNYPTIGGRSTTQPHDSISALSHELSIHAELSSLMKDNVLKYEASTRMAAVNLAIQLYQFDHAAQWPTKLQDLVPDYLPAVPVDPYSQSNQSLNYTLVDGQRPIVSSRLEASPPATQSQDR